MTFTPAFALADLEAFDPQSARAASGRERRFLCPLCGEGKPRDSAHRCFCVNAANGAWNCKRCKAAGKLTDFWNAADASTRGAGVDARTRARQRRAQLSTLPDVVASRQEPKVVSVQDEEWRKQLHGARALDGTPAQLYLSGRGIALETARAAGVLFAPSFWGKPASLFPICDRGGALVAANGRYFDERAGTKTRSAGPKSHGVFYSPTLGRNGRIFTPFDITLPTTIITEAPIDALSLATAGYPAIALVGTSGPAWLHLACGLKRVLLAFDADAAGDRASVELTRVLTPYGANCRCLRPEGAKDWNEMLQRHGKEELSDWLAAKLLSAP